MPVKLFFCYAHEDERLLNKLKSQLSPLLRQGLIEMWHDRKISAGIKWEEEIKDQLNTAQIILLLVSPDFINSDYCYSIEMKRALERHDLRKAQVIPIILRPCDWHNAPFSKLQALPEGGKPITTWANSDQALVVVAQGIQEAIQKLPASRPSDIEFSIQHADINSFEADVLALKYAQAFYGTDEVVVHLLNRVGITIDALRPNVGDYRYVQTQNCIQTPYALFIGVPDLVDFNYQNIQDFSMQVLNVLAQIAPTTKHIAMTIHGAGFGLDEIEAFLAQFRGYLYALQREQFPPQLKKITIIDRNSERVIRLRQAFDENFSSASFITEARNRKSYILDLQQLQSTFKRNQDPTRTTERKRIGMESEAKPHVFVAMPFKKDMDDVFYYGIQQPVRAAGFLCERIDQEAFIGDILDQVKKKIETAVVVVAELSGANPNVYLEVGYAWGKGRPTILLMKDDQELRFDVHGQRCLKYESIRALEESLKNELKELKYKGFL